MGLTLETISLHYANLPIDGKGKERLILYQAFSRDLILQERETR